VQSGVRAKLISSLTDDAREPLFTHFTRMSEALENEIVSIKKVVKEIVFNPISPHS
jgi:hypothetical protein